MFTNYDGVLKVDGEVGNKKAYDPRAWSKLAENGMAARVVEACTDLRPPAPLKGGGPPPADHTLTGVPANPWTNRCRHLLKEPLAC